MIDEIVARIDKRRQELVDGVMAGQSADQLLKLGMLIGRHQGLTTARDIITGKIEEDAATRGDKV